MEAPWGHYLAVDCLTAGDDVRPVSVTGKFALAEPYRESGEYGQPSTVPAPELDAARDHARTPSASARASPTSNRS
ncbi:MULTISPECIES: hypothetical protein [Streptomyces]|uniref:hypothetical protein n=1 Tax=Streptomyces TaxID=1883 RepID=UPI001E326FEB|nr:MULTISPECIES: hypothetical protein [Streptomyces]UFQ13601.1 hypothetical protein J2N69_00395 [Streptomyces huasconensis]WCL83198.1 hypothetical protein PPN52_00390 [Streptomyces sp. JCM 35825]